MVNKMVEIRVISQKTDKAILLSPDDALLYLKNQFDKNRKWIYVNSNFEDPYQLNLNQIRYAETIVVTNELGGG